MIRTLLLVAVIAPPAKLPQPVIPVGGAFVRPAAALDDAVWKRLPHVEAKAADHDGNVGSYGGVRLADLLRDAGAPVGAAVRGKAARAYVLVSAADEYSAIFTLAELQTRDTRCAPLLANSRDRVALRSDDGPIRVVAPCDRTHARWVRGVTKLTVIVTPGAESALRSRPGVRTR